MDRKQLIKKYLEFFKSKNHKVIPNDSLILENDPTTLFNSAGMQPLVPYLLGQKHPQGKRLVNVQKCIRTIDIEEVGDNCHHTFLEMLGNWSLGDYWKQEAIEMTLEFLTNTLKIPKEKISVTCFKGDKNAPKDTESEKIWESLGIPKQKIKFLGRDNWWGPIGKIGPCGPSTEMFVNNIEIGNDVLMQYNKDEKGKYNLAKQKNIDFGGGVERILAILNKFKDNYLTEIWQPIIKKIEKLSRKKYKGNEKEMRIIADHIKASVFIIADGITPSNTEQGYVLRRLIRRAVRYGREMEIRNFTSKVAEPIFETYNDYEILKNKKKILAELEKEEEKFNQTLEKGLKTFKKVTKDKKELNCKNSFLLYQSYGFPLEMIEEECKKNKIKFSKKEFEKEFEKHQKLSRTASAGKFKSGLADNSEATTKLHTTTHLLLAALRTVLKDKNIIQKGSNITPERLRLDFSFSRKLTKEEIKKIEDLVNAQIQNSCEVKREEMSPEKAKKQGAIGVFDKKYGEIVSVYTIGNFSKEICSGPHIKNLCELGKFKIKKEESSSSGVRRIKAILE
ncbi:alanine--tRNA ligase [Candidatus Pacearchaeota archaeon]|nr:alanine--tRNA ligase [Candidatus Pacearchaeota archaeon]MCK5150036.1 alanine--tRNA ligase [Candidatus Pacearchaeota archaeon]